MSWIGTDYFIIPRNNKNSYYVYFPLKGCFFSFGEELLQYVVQYCECGNIEDKYSILKNRLEKISLEPTLSLAECKSSFPELLCFLLSEKCNLACTYCYAHDSHVNIELGKTDIKDCLDYFFSFRSNSRRIAFLGGGEPLLSWDLIEYAVNYSKVKADEAHEVVSFSITSNLTILTTPMIEFIKKNNIVVGASFDILPEVQNSQRLFLNGNGSFFIVDKNIRLLLENGIVPRIRSTITATNVEKMADMVQFVANNYPGIHKMHFEHVSDRETLNDWYIETFATNFFKALTLAQKHKIVLTNSAINSLKSIRKNFCCAEFCVTASKEIISCHRVSVSNNGFNPFRYGSLLNGKILLDECNDNLFIAPKKCNDCFAKFNCAGGCRYDQYILGTNHFANYCNFMQKMMISYFDFLLSK